MSRIVLPELIRDARPLYMVGLQPALNNLVATYNAHNGPLNTIKFEYDDAFPWIQVSVVVIAIAVGTMIFLSSVLIPDGPKQKLDKRTRDVMQRLKDDASQKTSSVATKLNVHGGVLDPATWLTFPLVSKTALSPNTNLYRFKIPALASAEAAREALVDKAQGTHLGLPIGQHISVQAEIGGKKIARSYTPTTLDGEDPGHFHLVVKAYEKGNISRYLSMLTVGQEVQVKGPRGKFIYSSTLSPHLLMLAGGTGLTPMYQIIKASLRDAEDKTVLRLIYANVNEEDILLREDLDKLAKSSNGRFQVYYVLNNAPANWTGGQGFITREMIEKFMPSEGVGKPVGGSKVLLCGPPPMINAMKGHLSAIGYPPPNTISKLEDQVFCF